ncbi:hypothetical protein IMG5_124960 [Ichthyophthirius multifiliis]|uniref:Cyclin-dependent kinase 2 homolog n=1 Tax=Ichthyophthirius multifiliis TaxID=5932 RepID=G0QVP2_ICHMU|nr:hypothetical protein IMG5_124960 [Ichthyophthirius multifiliis]EGR30729.1 hypothetical protein IMG5_124960 [Ichthyophthirius multifiliis]|eukprot:XP_004032316.1 hypothetical protein IMG5_124960 [Ichthyophthirius multifiliis]
MGISRPFPNSVNEQLTGNMITRLYRPPEILFGSKHYNQSVDMWSFGCTIAELFLSQNKKHFFHANSEIEQLCVIFQIRGAANESNWTDCTKLSLYMDFQDLQAQDLQELIPNAPKECIQIIDQLLQLDPKKRSDINKVIYYIFQKKQFYIFFLRFQRINGQMKMKKKGQIN